MKKDRRKKIVLNPVTPKEKPILEKKVEDVPVEIKQVEKKVTENKKPKKKAVKKAAPKKSAAKKVSSKKQKPIPQSIPKIDFKRVRILESEDENRVEMYFKDGRKISLINEKNDVFAIVLKRVLKEGESYSPAKIRVDSRAKIKVGYSEVTMSKMAIQALYLAIGEMLKRNMF